MNLTASCQDFPIFVLWGKSSVAPKLDSGGHFSDISVANWASGSMLGLNRHLGA